MTFDQMKSFSLPSDRGTAFASAKRFDIATTAVRAAAATKSIIIGRSGSDMRKRPTVSVVRAAVKAAAPIQSTPVSCRIPLGSLASATIAINESGMLDQKVYSHPIQSAIAPAQTGPNTLPASAAAPTMPNATIRRRAPTSVSAAASDIGITAPAPIDCTTLETIAQRY